MYTMGLDVGTQGARAVVLDARGVCYANTDIPFGPEVQIAGLPEGHREQDPRCWLRGIDAAIGGALEQLRDVGVPPQAVGGLAVAGTSGTVLAVDRAGAPLCNAIMYNDARAESEAEQVRAVAAAHCRRHGYGVSSSFALPKLMWLAAHRPAVIEQAAHLCHATDIAVGHLTGNYGRSDFSTCLKCCYDLIDLRWPEFLEAELGLPVEKLPLVSAPGTVVGTLRPELATRFGLAPGTRVSTGCTDGTAGFLASGAAAPGDASTTIGTTLVLRCVSRELVRDPAGRVYCHRHPDGTWLPGGACSVGAEAMRHFLAGEDLQALAERAAALLPCTVLSYPLIRPGERFPFVDPWAEGFCVPPPGSPAESYAAIIQGVAFVERWCYELLGDLGADRDGPVYTVGGGARSRLWNRVRAQVLNRRVCIPRLAVPAVGAAMLAARALGETDALQNMVSLREEFEPDPRQVSRYEVQYNRFRELCRERGLGEG